MNKIKVTELTALGLALRVIKYIKAVPDEARQSSGADLATFWDEYKDQVQFEEYDSWDLYQDMVEGMAKDELGDLDEKQLNKLISNESLTFIEGDYNEYDKNEIPEVLVGRIVSLVRGIAEEEEINYKKDLDYIRYNVGDIFIVAEILRKVGPQSYFVNAYSECTGNGGEQGEINLGLIDEECDVEIISKEEFEKQKMILKLV